jgi:hypothetical protein
MGRQAVQNLPEHKWELVNAVARSPLLSSPQVSQGIELAAVERILLETDELAAADRERLLHTTRELAKLYSALTQPSTQQARQQT